MLSPTLETQNPSDMYSPTWETHIPSDMFSATWKQIYLVMCVPLPEKQI